MRTFQQTLPFPGKFDYNVWLKPAAVAPLRSWASPCWVLGFAVMVPLGFAVMVPLGFAMLIAYVDSPCWSQC